MLTEHGNKGIAPPRAVPNCSFDPFDPDVLTAPTAFYDALLGLDSFAYLPAYSALVCGRYDVTKEVFSDHQRFSSASGVGLADFALAEPWRPPSIILEVDPPAHARTRRALMKTLSPKVVRSLTSQFEADADSLIEDVLKRGDIDAVSDIAEAFPTRVFPTALGLCDPDPRKLLDYGAMVFNAVGPDNAVRRASMAKAPEIVPWINEKCDRAQLKPEGFGAALYGMADAGELSEGEAGMLVRSLLSAGMDTTVSGIGNAIWALAQNPDQYTLLREDPGELALPAFEETLRLTSPVHAFFRTALEDTEVAGTQIEAGTKILCVLGAANIDPRHWQDPLRFDIKRKTIGHMALGAGIHTCVGQNIARAEGRAILRALAEQVDRIEPLGEAVWRPNNALHALDRFPVRLHPS